MRNGEVFIDVWNCRARLARYEQLPDGGMTWNYAANWEDLEEAAEEAVDAAGGWITASGHYPCPDELAQRAVWPVRRLMNVSDRYGDWVPATPEDVREVCELNGWPVPDLRERQTEDAEGREIREFVDTATGEVVLRDEWQECQEAQ